jgi:hypothetical protein
MIDSYLKFFSVHNELFKILTIHVSCSWFIVVPKFDIVFNLVVPIGQSGLWESQVFLKFISSHYCVRVLSVLLFNPKTVGVNHILSYVYLFILFCQINVLNISTEAILFFYSVGYCSSINHSLTGGNRKTSIFCTSMFINWYVFHSLILRINWLCWLKFTFFYFLTNLLIFINTYSWCYGFLRHLLICIVARLLNFHFKIVLILI